MNRQLRWLMLLVCRLGSADGEIEVVIVECGVNDFVPSVLEGRPDATDNATPTVQEKDFHLIIAPMLFAVRFRH